MSFALTDTNNTMNTKTNSFEKHRQNPDVTLSEYTKGLRVALGEEIQDLKKIYLDTNYWLELRDVVLKRQQNENFVEILSMLRKGVSENKFICPISDENFYEILQQSDQETLMSSAQIIDELSKGVCLISTEERVKVEIMHFVYSMTGFDKNSFYHPDVFVWSKVSYIFGGVHPVLPQIHPEEELIFQKSYLDHMWSIPFSEMIKVIGMDNILQMPKYKDVTKEINEKKAKHHEKKSSFKKLFLSEIAGTVDIYRNLFEDILAYFFEKKTGRKPTAQEVNVAKPSLMANSVYNLFRKNKLGEHLPSLIIGAGLHASVRLDIGRKYKPNDMSDFQHAKAALPYYHYFFTERSLRDLVSRTNLSFDKKYNCNVCSDPGNAVEVLTILCS